MPETREERLARIRKEKADAEAKAPVNNTANNNTGAGKIKNVVAPPSDWNGALKPNISSNSTQAELKDFILQSVQEAVAESVSETIPAVLGRIRDVHELEQLKAQRRARDNRFGEQNMSAVDILVKEGYLDDTPLARNNAIRDMQKHPDKYNALLEQIAKDKSNPEVRAGAAKERLKKINIDLPKSRAKELDEMSEQIRNGTFANDMKIIASDRVAFS